MLWEPDMGPGPVSDKGDTRVSRPTFPHPPTENEHTRCVRQGLSS